MPGRHSRVGTETFRLAAGVLECPDVRAGKEKFNPLECWRAGMETFLAAGVLECPDVRAGKEKLRADGVPEQPGAGKEKLRAAALLN